MIVHPEVGKWLIALGERRSGWTRSAGGRVGGRRVADGAGDVPAGARMTGSTLLGCVAGLLLRLDGLHFVLSRLALLDIFLAFFMLCAVPAWSSTATGTAPSWPRLVPRPGDRPPDAWGPVRGLLFRPWLLASGVCLGLAVGTKWTALYPLAAFGILAWLWSAGARRSFGVRWPVSRSALVDGVPAFASTRRGRPASSTPRPGPGGWSMRDEYERARRRRSTPVHRGATVQGRRGQRRQQRRRWPTATEPDADGLGEVVQSLRSLAYYHRDVYRFHTHFLNCSDHSYASKPSGWLLINRPVSVAVETDIEPGDQGCDAPPDSTCLRQVLLLGTPDDLVGRHPRAALRGGDVGGARDWRFGVVVVGVASTWLPWLQYDDRPIFFFYAIAILPFLVLGLTLAIGKLIGRSRAPSPRRTAGVVVAGSYLVLTLLNFAWFYPMFTYGLLSRAEWLDRVWFSRWI